MEEIVEAILEAEEAKEETVVSDEETVEEITEEVLETEEKKEEIA